MNWEDGTCLRCGRPLKDGDGTMLELNCRTGLFCEPGKVPEDESQGGFYFGPDCARAVLKGGGKNVRVGRAKRLNS